MDNLKVYKYNRKDVVLVNSDMLKDIAIAMAGGLLAVPLEELQRSMSEEEIQSLSFLSYDDAMGGEYLGGEIVSAYIVNPENEQRLAEEFVSVEYAETDEAEREILTDTTPYHAWRSLRSRTKDAIEGAISYAMQEESGDSENLTSLLRSLHREYKGDWLNDCNSYAVERLDINLVQEFNSMWRCAEAEVSGNMGYVPDIDYE